MAKLNGVKTVDMVNGEITKVSYDGVDYVKVEGDAEHGDLGLRIKEDRTFVRVGEFYPIIKGFAGMTCFKDDEGDEPSLNRSKFELFRKQSAKGAPSIEDVNAKVDGLAERVTALEVTTERTLKEGDKVRVLARGEFGGVGLDEGDIGTVVDGCADVDDEYFIRVDSADDHDYFRPQDLELVAEVESEEAPLAVGDYAKLLISTRGREGDIVEIIEGSPYMKRDGFLVNRSVSDGSVAQGHPTWLVRATDEEVATAKAKAKADAKAKVFTQNGRKPNEYRNGDIVVITNGHGSGHKVGSIAEVKSAHWSGTGAYLTDDYAVSCEPVAFAESRLDRK